MICQRIIIGKDINQVKRAFLISAGFLILIKLAVAWIAFLVFAADSSVSADNLLGHIIDNYTYPGFKGFIIAGIMAMAMSMKLKMEATN